MARAMVFDGPERELRLATLPLPETLLPGQVLLRMVAATVCGSDLHTISGLRTEPTPAILGHEGVGRVEVSRRPGVRPGQLVTFSICDTCGGCDRCAAGLPQKCRSLMKYGHSALSSGSGLNGCYSSHLLLRQGTHVVVLPAALAAQPALAAPANCALATVQCAARAAQTHLAGLPRNRALVQGAGLLGLFACSVLRDRLAFKEVFCTDLVPERLEMARKFGAIPLQPKDAPDQSDETTGFHRDLNDSFDLVIEVCGSPKVFAAGVSFLRPGGLYVLVGLVHPRSQLDVTGQQLIRKCLTLKGVHNYAPEDLDSAVEYLETVCSSGTYPLRELLSPPHPLQQMTVAGGLVRLLLVVLMAELVLTLTLLPLPLASSHSGDPAGRLSTSTLGRRRDQRAQLPLLLTATSRERRHVTTDRHAPRRRGGAAEPPSSARRRPAALKLADTSPPTLHPPSRLHDPLLSPTAPPPSFDRRKRRSAPADIRRRRQRVTRPLTAGRDDLHSGSRRGGVGDDRAVRRKRGLLPALVVDTGEVLIQLAQDAETPRFGTSTRVSAPTFLVQLSRLNSGAGDGNRAELGESASDDGTSEPAENVLEGENCRGDRCAQNGVHYGARNRPADGRVVFHDSAQDLTPVKSVVSDELSHQNSGWRTTGNLGENSIRNKDPMRRHNDEGYYTQSKCNGRMDSRSDSYGIDCPTFIAEASMYSEVESTRVFSNYHLPEQAETGRVKINGNHVSTEDRDSHFSSQIFEEPPTIPLGSAPPGRHQDNTFLHFSIASGRNYGDIASPRVTFNQETTQLRDSPENISNPHFSQSVGNETGHETAAFRNGHDPTLEHLVTMPPANIELRFNSQPASARLKPSLPPPGLYRLAATELPPLFPVPPGQRGASSDDTRPVAGPRERPPPQSQTGPTPLPSLTDLSDSSTASYPVYHIDHWHLARIQNTPPATINIGSAYARAARADGNIGFGTGRWAGGGPVFPRNQKAAMRRTLLGPVMDVMERTMAARMLSPSTAGDRDVMQRRSRPRRTRSVGSWLKRDGLKRALALASALSTDRSGKQGENERLARSGQQKSQASSVSSRKMSLEGLQMTRLPLQSLPDLTSPLRTRSVREGRPLFDASQFLRETQEPRPTPSPAPSNLTHHQSTLKQLQGDQPGPPTPSSKLAQAAQQAGELPQPRTARFLHLTRTKDRPESVAVLPAARDLIYPIPEPEPDETESQIWETAPTSPAFAPWDRPDDNTPILADLPLDPDSADSKQESNFGEIGPRDGSAFDDVFAEDFPDDLFSLKLADVPRFYFSDDFFTKPNPSP